MNKRSENAIQLFNNGYNCSQSVLSAFCDKYDVDEKLALRIACGLGGGVRSGEICGAVTGAVLVIGLKYGNDTNIGGNTKQLCYDKTTEFIHLFKQKNDSVTCRELLECDISTPQGREYAKVNKLFATTCVGIIQNTVELLEELGY